MNTGRNGRAILMGAGIAGLLAGGLALNRAQAGDAAPMGKIAPWTAMKSANADLKGKAINATFEEEGGKWLYAVLVAKDKKLYEVEVDAMTGKAGKPESVTAEAEAAEMKDDLNKALGNPVKTKEEPGEKDEKDEKDEKPEKP